MRPRLVKAAILALLVAGGIVFYRSVLRPDPHRLEAWAEGALRDMFGPDVTHGPMEVDLLEGVKVSSLSVPGRPGAEPALWADSVEIRHDVLALAAGVPRLKSVKVLRAKVATYETDDGNVALDFEFHAPVGTGGGKAPEIDIEASELRFRAAATSSKFRPGYVLTLGNLHARARYSTPGDPGALSIDGGFTPLALGLDPAPGSREGEITFGGMANSEKGLLDLYALWDPMTLTPEIRAVLATPLRETIDAKRLGAGPHRLAVRVVRDPDVEGGTIQVMPELRIPMQVDIGDWLPGTELIDASTRDQLNELFGRIQLDVALRGDDVDIRELTAHMAGGHVRATGRVEENGQVVRLNLSLEGVHLDDPALRKALGPAGEKVFSEFAISGTVDAKIWLWRERGAPFQWEADVTFQDVTLAYFGRPPDGKLSDFGKPVRYGFPYEMRHASGQLTIKPGSLEIGAIEGRHGPAVVRIRGSSERSRDGLETGYVRWSDAGADVRLTVEALGIPIDDDVVAAVAQSEIAGFFERFRLGGTLDHVIVELNREAGRDVVAVADVRIEMSGETLTFAPFPVPLTGIVGTVNLYRPPVGDRDRGRRLTVEVDAKAAGGSLAIRAEANETEKRGRIRVTASDLRLEGPLTEAILSGDAKSSGVGEAWRFLAPSGPADAVVDVPAYADPGPETYRVALKGVTARVGAGSAKDPRTAPVVTGITGTIEAVGPHVRMEGITASLDGSPVRVQGSLDGGIEGAWDLSVEGDGIRVSEGLLRAVDLASGGTSLFPPGIAPEPGGRLDLAVRLKRPQGKDSPFEAVVSARRADLTVRVGDLALHVTGSFHVEKPDVRLEDVTVSGSGVSIRVPSARLTDAGLEGALTARLHDVDLGPELLGLLPESIRATAREMTKDRRLEAESLSVDMPHDGPMTIRGSLGLTARPGALPGGAARGLVEFAPLTVGRADVAGVRTVTGLLRLSGVSVDVGVLLEEVTGSVEIAGVRTGADATPAAPGGASAGTVAAGEARIRGLSGRVAGLAVRDLDAPVAWHGGILRVKPLTAGLYGGRLEAEVAVHTRAPVAFEGRATVTGMRLEALRDEHSRGGPDLAGLVSAEIEFQARAGSLDDLTAAGTVRVREGNLGDLPVVANLPALFSRLFPMKERPKFERADICFTISRETVRADSIVLAGPLFEMDGHGTLDFGGQVDLTFSPQFIKSMALPGILQVPGIGDLVGLLREDPLYVVKVRGDISNPKTTLSPFPFLGPRRAAPTEFEAPDFLGKPSRRIPRWFR